MAGALHDPCSLIFRCIRITDIDRYTSFAHREYRILMQYAGSHVGKLAEFTVSDRLDWLWIVDDPWICDQKSGDIGPVLITGCPHCPRNDRSCDIRTSTRKCFDGSILFGAVKSRNDRTLCFCKTLRQYFICFLRHKVAILIKKDHFCRIHKFISKVVCHNDTIQILTAGRCVINTCFIFKILGDFLKFFL